MERWRGEEGLPPVPASAAAAAASGTLAACMTAAPSVVASVTTAATPASTPRSARPTEEADLPRRAASGDAAAFDALFAQHKDRVYGCLYHLLDGDMEAVEDAVGAVFLAAFRALPRFRGDAAFGTYLYRIAVNEAHRRRGVRDRLRKREAAVEWRDGEAPDSAEFVPGPERTVLREEEQRMLARAVRALPEPYRTPVILRYLNDLPAVEVAQILNRPAGTVRYQVSRGLDILRERLEAVWPR